MNNTEKDTLIEINGLYQIFGEQPDKVLPKVKAGASKDDILAETGHTVGLQDINLEVKRGEIFVIMGLSGSGKSTLIRHFNRLIDPTAGEIKVDGENIMELSLKDLTTFRRHKMAMVFQHFGLMPHRCVLDNVGYGLAIKGEKKAEWKPKATSWLETVGLAGYEDQYPSQLSGGQQQRVGLARALCTDAEILLMDEAFSALDPLIRNEMQEQLIELQETLQKTIIFITHDLDEALRIGDRIAVLKDGKLIQVGTPVDIVLKPTDDYVKAFAKGVNRARALTAHTIMSPCQNVVEGSTVGQIKEQITDSNKQLFVVEQGIYKGVIPAQAVAEAADDVSLESLFTPLKTFHSASPLQDIVPVALVTPYSLPITNKKGELKGQIEAHKLAKVLDN
ncbi:quaternary amine ABC transporter ATP-binding protein [Marinomonas dokdonensis]|uniref:quaternary amine ABC transporter ATP-binding protein n=1 Tax=Marinomonas dokdonensis TaxID=328224 RepID=UPI0040558EBC